MSESHSTTNPANESPVVVIVPTKPLYEVALSEERKVNIEVMRRAILLGHQCKPLKTAYNVGAVLLDANGKELSTGFSRELPGNTHAEECCLLKLKNTTVPPGATLYTTMEPCSLRLSGKKSCTERIIEAKVSRVIVGVGEPDVFVDKCEGIEKLRAAGVVVDELDGLQRACLAPNVHLLAQDEDLVMLRANSLAELEKQNTLLNTVRKGVENAMHEVAHELGIIEEFEQEKIFRM